MKIAFVLEFLCGSDAAICGISKTYDLYIEKLYELGHEIIIFSLFRFRFSFFSIKLLLSK